MRGGKRKGAGRPKGKPTKQTLEKQKVLAALSQRIMAHADVIFHAQFALAKGTIQVFRVDEVKDGKKTKRVHTLVTDSEEIKRVLDEHEGGPGVVDDAYYFVSEVTPDNRAIDSLFNRAFGKPKETVEHSGPEGGPIETSDASLTDEQRAGRIAAILDAARARRGRQTTRRK